MDPINNEHNPVKRPVGMTILLILSLVNAIYQSLSALILYIYRPIMENMLESGQIEESFRVLFPTMDNTMVEAVMDNVAVQLQVNPHYYLALFVLFIGSLVGVLKMFKLQRLGFHIYSIAQLLMLIAAVVFVRPYNSQFSFFNEFLTTLMFILIYHLFFKRIEFMRAMQDQKDQKEDPFNP